MAKYRTKKPHIIEAVQWFPDVMVPGVDITKLKTGISRKVDLRPGDYIITGARGAPYALSEAAFEENYKPADPEGNGFREPR